MADLTAVEAVEFFREHKRHIHVYYQFQDERVIRESCLVEDSGWFVRGNGIVATTARAGSPITVTRWTEDEGSPTKIVVFYIDENDNIIKCEGDHELSSTQWVPTVIGLASQTEIAADSQLAIARPDRDDKLLRLFYQGRNEAGGNVNGPLREIRYDADDGVWAVEDNAIVEDAVGGTCLAAISDKSTQVVRLYYKGNDSHLREMYCSNEYIWRSQSSVIRRQDTLAQSAPISAISWKDDRGNLQIRIFTILVNAPNSIWEISYSYPNWKPAISLSITYKDGTAIASCRNTGLDMTVSNPICVFCQTNARRAINAIPVPANSSQTSRDLAAALLLPSGIPISRGESAAPRGNIPTPGEGGGGNVETSGDGSSGGGNVETSGDGSGESDAELRRLRDMHIRQEQEIRDLQDVVRRLREILGVGSS